MSRLDKKNGTHGARTASTAAGEGQYDDFRILSCLRRRTEPLFAATLPLGETSGLEMGATLSGVAFYQAKGYAALENLEAPLGNGEALSIVRMAKEFK